MEEFGMIWLVAIMAISIFTGRAIGRLEERERSTKNGYAHGLVDGRRLERQAQERALAVTRTKYSDDVKVYEKRT